MDFIEQHRTYIRQFGVILNPAPEYPLGQDQYPGFFRGFAVHASGVTNQPIDCVDCTLVVASSEAEATIVVLPAPGGAISTAFEPAASAAFNSGSTASTGRVTQP